MEYLNIKYVNDERNKNQNIKSTLATSERELMNLKIEMNKLTKKQSRNKNDWKIGQ